MYRDFLLHNDCHMTRGTFYCCQIPSIADLKKIDWLIEYPARDWEFEVILGQEVWMVQYDVDHPSMQNWNRFTTCYAWGFSEVVFEDDVLEDVPDDDPSDSWQEDTVVISP